jgi:hypothetical protein
VVTRPTTLLTLHLDILGAGWSTTTFKAANTS